MKIVGSSGRLQIYGDDISTYDSLPVGTYNVSFNKMTGYYLTPWENLEVKEKVYGRAEKRVDKVLRTFSIASRNTGVILSGRKGSGKSLFARLLASKGRDAGLPMLIVDTAYPGIAGFLSSIEQECIVLFDEFEKMFTNRADNGPSPQEELLPLFDGIDSGKKLFVITCNDRYKLNDCLLSRPGRFHYHFIMHGIPDEEIKEYLEDNLIDGAKKWIDSVVMYAKIGGFTYDILRALVFELNQGYPLSEVMEDLNVEIGQDLRFNAIITLSDGHTAVSDQIRLDYNGERTYTWCKVVPDDGGRIKEGYTEVRIGFYMADAFMTGNGYSIDPKKIEVYIDSDNLAAGETEPSVKTAELIVVKNDVGDKYIPQIRAVSL